MIKNKTQIDILRASLSSNGVSKKIIEKMVVTFMELLNKDIKSYKNGILVGMDEEDILVMLPHCNYTARRPEIIDDAFLLETAGSIRDMITGIPRDLNLFEVLKYKFDNKEFVAVEKYDDVVAIKSVNMDRMMLE